MPDSRSEPRLSTVELIALAISYYGEPGTLGGAIPDETWDALHDRGLVRTAIDFTGEGTTVTTGEGIVALLAAIKQSEVGAGA